MSQSMNFAAPLESFVTQFLSSWDIVSTAIAALLVLVFAYPIVYGKEPDTHPFLLSKQATASPIRQEGESAVYRSTDIPYGYPLKSGLAIKDPGSSKWTSGRDGDLRDIWRRAATGTRTDDGTATGSPAQLKTILGIERIIDHDIRGLTGEINLIGQYWQEQGVRRVAVCLSNSVELLCTIFAGSFYRSHVVIIPHQSLPKTYTTLIQQSQADTFIAEAGTVPASALPGTIKRIIWVTRPDNSHVDFTEDVKVPAVSWTELVQKHSVTASSEVPPYNKDDTTEPPSIGMFWPKRSGEYELIEYTQKNIISGVAAFLTTFPRNSKLNPSDTVLLTSPLTNSYTLCAALATLFSCSTLLLNSVAGDSISILTAAKSSRQLLKPNYIIASSGSVSALINDLTALSSSAGPLNRLSSFFTHRDIASGSMPRASAAYLPSSLSKLKILFIAQPSTTSAPDRLTSSSLATLRTLLSTKAVLALTHGRVAGAVAQTNSLDYRDKGAVCCIGPLMSSLEGNLVAQEEYLVKNLGAAKGTLAVRGPAVVVASTTSSRAGITSEKDDDSTQGPKRPKTRLEGVMCRVDGDGTLILA